ncbi:amidohydrolase family protein [Frigidibacter sp. MR17.14]|uniref:amidohydrolase family protein n=1 Tax=Frigidibacter sp. MR17.14 TaxID=3126509 RepID=UPI003012BA70
MHELVVRGGRLGLCSGWCEADLAVDDGRITAIGKGLVGRHEIAADGMWVLPGGVDPHCHVAQPGWAGQEMAEGFASAGRAALAGGTTTILPFAVPDAGQDMRAGLARAMALAEGVCPVDYGFHAVSTMAAGDPGAQMPGLVAAGVTSVKAFTTYEGFAVTDAWLLALMDAAAAAGALVMVHPENDAIVAHATAGLIASGRTGLAWHAASRPELAEVEAIGRVAALARTSGARVKIVHVSGAGALAAVRQGRALGARLLAETCPQYLFQPDAPADDAAAARHLFSPPARGAGAVPALWQGLEQGAIEIWSSDHSPHALSGKLDGDGPARFDRAISGVPGLQTRLPLLFSEGLVTGRIDLPRYLELAGAAAARAYGLPGKGRIAPGADADLVLWDPARRGRIRDADQHSAAGYSPFDGREVTGCPVTVLLRGEIAHEAAAAAPFPGPARGRFLHRAPLTRPAPLPEEIQP